MSTDFPYAFGRTPPWEPDVIEDQFNDLVVEISAELTEDLQAIIEEAILDCLDEKTLGEYVDSKSTTEREHDGLHELIIDLRSSVFESVLSKISIEKP